MNEANHWQRVYGDVTRMALRLVGQLGLNELRPVEDEGNVAEESTSEDTFGHQHCLHAGGADAEGGSWEMVHGLMTLFSQLTEAYYSQAVQWMYDEVWRGCDGCRRLRAARQLVHVLAQQCGQPASGVLASLLRAFVACRRQHHAPLVAAARATIVLLGDEGGWAAAAGVMRELSAKLSVTLNPYQLLQSFVCWLQQTTVDDHLRVACVVWPR